MTWRECQTQLTFRVDASASSDREVFIDTEMGTIALVAEDDGSFTMFMHAPGIEAEEPMPIHLWVRSYTTPRSLRFTVKTNGTDCVLWTEFGESQDQD